jgi:hypothetical protein
VGGAKWSARERKVPTNEHQTVFPGPSAHMHEVYINILVILVY